MTICERHSGGRILCIRLSGLGDIVHAMNALTLLRQDRPDAHIAWLVQDQFASLLRGHPCIDELIEVPRGVWGRRVRNPLRWPRLIPEWSDFAHLLRGKQFDITIDFQSNLKSGCFVIPARAEQRVGFAPPVGDWMNSRFETDLVYAPGEGVHRIERDLALLAPLGIPTRYAPPVLPRSPADREAMDAALDGLLTGGPVVIIHPGTSEFAAFKRWMPERYARLADRLVAEVNADVLITHGPSDRPLAEQVVGLMRRRGHIAPATRSLQQLTHLLSRADLFIGSDTGPMHMASALGVPIVTLFGPKDAGQTGPYCSRSIVVTADVHCRPCTRRRCAGQRCMAAIGVDPVFDGALAALDGGGTCRADSGPPPGAFSGDFELVGLNGQVSTHCSMPEFYTRICEPGQLLVPAREPRARQGQRETGTIVSLPAQGGVRRFRAVRRPPLRSSARAFLEMLTGRPAVRVWRAARGLAAARVPAPIPACLVSRRDGLSHEDVLLTEDPGLAATLRDLLAGDPGWQGMARPARVGLVEATACLLRALHRAGYCHGWLRPESLLAGGSGGHWQLRLTDLECTIYVGRLPRVAADVLFGMDLGRLAGALGMSISRAEALRFFRAYRRDFMEDPARWRCLLMGVRLTAGGRDLNPWLRRLRVG
jgi:lipopolysaccharide heptosyltransferase I